MGTYIIGFSGKAGAGKDTSADYVEKYLIRAGVNVKRVAFANLVKEYGSKYFGDVCDPVVKDYVSRKVLQGIGQMFRSEVNDNYWVNKTIEKTPDTGVTLITDVRYRNEADIILQDRHLGTVIRLDGRTSLEGDAAEHSSEVDLDDYTFPYRYNNTGTLQELYSFLEGVLEKELNLDD